MSHKRFLVELTPEERVYWKQRVACGSPKTQARRRAQIWLLCDQGPEGPAGTVSVSLILLRSLHRHLPVFRPLPTPASVDGT